MADEQVATRAPESDAAADSQPPTTDTPTSEEDTPGISMSDHCTSDRPTPINATQPAGELTALNDIPCYVAKPQSYPQEPGKLLLLLTGGTGLHSVNNQLQADAYAARGFVVVMPDQFGGDPAPNVSILTEEEAKHAAEVQQRADDAEGPSLLDRIKLGAAEAAKSFLIDMWLARHTPEKVLPLCSKVLAGAREAFADAVANGGGVYGAGYCFGAKYVLLLSGTAGAEGGAEGEATPQLKAGAIAHGTLITKEDIEGVKVPTCMACVAGDNLFPDDVREQGRASLELNAIEHEIQIFDGVPHGFAVVGDYADERIKEKQGDAFEMMCSWLENH